MPRIHDPYLMCPLYLFADRNKAEKNDQTGGSGFIAGYKTEDGAVVHLYAITNRHVIEEGFSVIRLNKLLGGYDIMETNKESWVFHPEDDIAVRPIGPDVIQHKFSVVTVSQDENKNLLMTEERIHRHNIGVGDEVFMVGRFVGHQGSEQNLPLARFGCIAMMPIEPISKLPW